MCGSGGGGGGGDGGAADRERKRQEKQDAAISRINTLFGVAGIGLDNESKANKLKLEGLYKGVGDDVSSYLTDDLNNQYEDAERLTRFSSARRGVRGGSSELDAIDNNQEKYDKGVVDVSNRASDASSRMRIADSKTRLDLIQRILSGMSGDAAITSAQQSMSDNADSIRRQSLMQSLDNVFGDVSYANEVNARKRGAQRAEDFYSTYYPSTKSYSGSVN